MYLDNEKVYAVMLILDFVVKGFRDKKSQVFILNPTTLLDC